MSYDPRPMRRLSLVIGMMGLAGVISASFLIYVAGASGSFRPLSVIVPAGHAAPARLDNAGHVYVLDGFGGLHPVGSSPVLSTSASWPNKDIAFSLALFPDGTGGYVMDGWGRLHPLGVAPAIDSGVYWPHWIGAREIVMAPWSSASDPAGYLLDADGGIHPFGDAPAAMGNTTWPGKGIARALVLSGGSTRDAVMGYTLDGFGGGHPFGGARGIFGSAQWTAGIARGLGLTTARHGLLCQGHRH